MAEPMKVRAWFLELGTISSFAARIPIFSTRVFARGEPSEATPGNDDAKGTAGPEAPSRHGSGRHHGRENCDGRNRRETESAFGQGPFWKSGIGGACREADGARAVGDCEESGWGQMAVTLQRPDYSRVKREVRRIQEEFGITSPPVDPTRIARGLGVSVIFVTFETSKNNVSGFFDCEEKTIFVNKDEFPLGRVVI